MSTAKTAPTGDQHYEIEIDHDAGTATLSERSVVDDSLSIATMKLTSSSNGAIINLFKSIDADKSGDIAADDFAKMAGDDAEFGDEGWKKLESHFDVDGDGSITMDEFRFGLKGYGMKVALESDIAFEAPHYWTLTQWVQEIESVFNKSVARETSLLSGWFQQYDGKKSAMRAKSNAAERAQDPTLMVIYQNEESTSQLKALFDVMDKDKSGTLDAADFAIMSKNPETASFWDELKANFDSDGDEEITFDEFSARIVSTVASRVSVGSIPRKDWTWRQVIARLTEWGNWMIQEQCREINDYFCYGEYQSKTTEHAEEGDQFGCGMHLGSPAFPGGEPKDAKDASNLGLSADFQALSTGTGGASVPTTFNDNMFVHAPVVAAPVHAGETAAAAMAAFQPGPAAAAPHAPAPASANGSFSAQPAAYANPYAQWPGHHGPPPPPPQQGGGGSGRPTVIYIY